MGKALNILQVVDWSKYDLQEWLRQFGCWLGVYRGTGKNLVMVDINECRQKLDGDERGEIIAQYICDRKNHDRPKRNQVACDISDDEARAVQKLVLDVINSTKSEILLDWMDAIIDRYFWGKSWPAMVTSTRTILNARQDVQCGLAVLHSKYPFIEYEKDEKSA